MSAVLLCHGTALALPLRDASVHCVVTSPPYYGLRDYGTGTWQGGEAACDHATGTARNDGGRHAVSAFHGSSKLDAGGSTYFSSVCGRCGATRVDQQLGLEASPEAYVAAMVQVFREVKRVLHPTGTCWINMGDSYSSGGRSSYGPGTNKGQPKDAPRPGQPTDLQSKNLLGMPWRLAFALQADGWILRSDIIWDKPSCMPESVQDRPTRSHEYVFLFSKQARYHYDAEAVKEATDMAYLLRRNPHGRAQNATAKNTIPGQGIKSNTSFHAAVTDALPYRNMRTVWRITSEPTGFQHFAAFPTALVRRCLLAGAPSQVCSQCGAPWKREVERGPLLDQRSHPGQPAHLSPQGYLRNGKSRCGINETVAVGDWFPTCPCAAGTAPSVVLDPFAGSGTTLLVARELGHHAVGVDLSYPYLRDIARERLGLADLARWEGRTGDAPAMDYSALPLFSGGAS